jgi:hypothetical protein
MVSVEEFFLGCSHSAVGWDSRHMSFASVNPPEGVATTAGKGNIGRRAVSFSRALAGCCKQRSSSSSSRGGGGGGVRLIEVAAHHAAPCVQCVSEAANENWKPNFYADL